MENKHRKVPSEKTRIIIVAIICVWIAVTFAHKMSQTPPKDQKLPAVPKNVTKPVKAETTPQLTQAQKDAIAAKKEQERLERERIKKEKYEACKKDLECWGNRHVLAAIVPSQGIIERYATYDFEWIDGFWGAKLTRFSWLDKSKLTLNYYGDQIKIQNRFGAWQRHIYMVQYDPINDVVLGVTVRPGRLK